MPLVLLTVIPYTGLLVAAVLYVITWPFRSSVIPAAASVMQVPLDDMSFCKTYVVPALPRVPQAVTGVPAVATLMRTVNDWFAICAGELESFT